MGKVGKFIGKSLGRIGGGVAGGAVGGRLGNKAAGKTLGQAVGSKVGETAGALLPFRLGGKVKRTGPIIAHKGEYVLPRAIKPTKTQKRKVARGKASRKK